MFDTHIHEINDYIILVAICIYIIICIKCKFIDLVRLASMIVQYVVWECIMAEYTYVDFEINLFQCHQLDNVDQHHLQHVPIMHGRDHGVLFNYFNNPY